MSVNVWKDVERVMKKAGSHRHDNPKMLGQNEVPLYLPPDVKSHKLLGCERKLSC